MCDEISFRNTFGSYRELCSSSRQNFTCSLKCTEFECTPQSPSGINRAWETV